MNTVKKFKILGKELSSKYEVSKQWFSISIKCYIPVMSSNLPENPSFDSHIIYEFKKNCFFRYYKIKGCNKVKIYQGKGKHKTEEWGKNKGRKKVWMLH